LTNGKQAVEALSRLTKLDHSVRARTSITTPGDPSDEIVNLVAVVQQGIG